MNKQLKLLAILIPFWISCNQVTSTNTNNKVTKIDLLKIKRKIVQTALDFDKLQWFYIDTLSLILLKNEHTENLTELHKFNSPVILKSRADIQKDSINFYLVIEELKIINDSAFIELIYPSQGAGADLKLIRELELWNIKTYGISEE